MKLKIYQSIEYGMGCSFPVVKVIIPPEWYVLGHEGYKLKPEWENFLSHEPEVELLDLEGV